MLRPMYQLVVSSTTQAQTLPKFLTIYKDKYLGHERPSDVLGEEDGDVYIVGEDDSLGRDHDHDLLDEHIRLLQSRVSSVLL